jgi:hypothetical protein
VLDVVAEWDLICLAAHSLLSGHSGHDGVGVNSPCQSIDSEASNDLTTEATI